MNIKHLIIVLLSLALASCDSRNEPSSSDKSANRAKNQKQVNIVRDTYGVPHIYAEDKYGLFYGYGYALGQDRLFQLEMAKRGAEGKAAEVLGDKYLEGDKKVRQGHYPALVQAQIEALDDSLLQPFEAYAAGVNAWIDVVNSEPENYLPKEFTHFDFSPSPWTSYDVFMLFIGNVAQIFCDSNEELNNLAFLQQLVNQHGHEKGWAIFDASMPLFDKDSPVTVPDSIKEEAVTVPSQPPSYLDQLALETQIPVRLAFDDDGQLLDIADPEERRKYLSRNLAQTGAAGNSGFRSASNIWLANRNKVKSATAALVSGPQLGWGVPSYVHAVGLHGAGYNVVGKAFMFPFFISAYTDQIAWGTTYGASDQTDIFQLKLNPDNPEEYFYKGRFQPFEKRVETIKVRDGDSVDITAYRSVHGLVVSRDIEKGVAYSKKRSWEGHEVKTAAVWVDLPKVKDFEEFRKQLSPMSTTINFYYMDKDGNIGYTHSGKYAQRQSGHDNRLPAIGDGSMDWQGIIPFEDNPHTYNPEQGYISNWNNRPARNWPSSDHWSGNWAKTNRVGAINERLDSADSLTPQQLWAINEEVSYADLNIQHLLPHLKQALLSQEQPAHLMEMLSALEHWDRRWWDEDTDGYYDSAATAIMDAWLRELLVRVLKDDVGEEFFYRFASPGYPTQRLRGSWDSGVGIKMIVRNLDALKTGTPGYNFFNGDSINGVMIESFKSAYSQLTETYGQEVTGWKIKVPSLKLAPFNYNGVPQSLPDSDIVLEQMMNRGAENNLYIAGNGTITGRDAYVPGQSGFIAPDGSKGKHYIDQLHIYQSFETKMLPLTKEQVGTMTEQAIEITY